MTDNNADPDGFLLIAITRAEVSVINEYSTKEAAKTHRRAAQSQGKINSENYMIRPIMFSDEPEMSDIQYEYRLVWEDHGITAKFNGFSGWTEEYDDIRELMNQVKQKAEAPSFTVHRRNTAGDIEYANTVGADPFEMPYYALD